jgi:hypothetical protein
MRYILQIYSNDAPEQFDALPEEQQQAIMSEYFAINQAPGVTGGDQLQPPATATTVRVQDGRTLTTDGPFAETKEALAGIFMVEVPDLDAAIGWAEKCPGAQWGVIEVRPTATAFVDGAWTR